MEMALFLAGMFSFLLERRKGKCERALKRTKQDIRIEGEKGWTIRLLSRGPQGEDVGPSY